MKIPIKSVFMVALFIVISISIFNWNSRPKVFHNGDIIFQTSKSSQSNAIFVASLSPYTHMGIIKETGKGLVVVEAVGPVKETSLAEWIDRGRYNRFAVFRHRAADSINFRAIFQSLRPYYGRPYDVFFSFENRSIYCSELVRIGYEAENVTLGKNQRVSELLINAPIVKSLIYRRAHKDPACARITRSQCMQQIANRELVTPVSIARDKKLEKIYSNYPF